jgi:hypothetical protein
MLEKIFEIDCNELARRDPFGIVNKDENIFYEIQKYASFVQGFSEIAFSLTYDTKKHGAMIGSKTCFSVISKIDNDDVFLSCEHDEYIAKIKFVYDENDKLADKVLYDLIDIHDIFHALQRGNYSEIPKIEDEPNRVFDGEYHRICLYRGRKAFSFEKKDEFVKFFRYE